jgi:hypothetical protein
MHIEFLVEEQSAEVMLREVVPRILPDVTFKTHPYQGKQDLLRKLPSRLRSYRRWMPQDWRIVVLLDADIPERCRELKARVEAMAYEAGFATPAMTNTPGEAEVLVRLAVEELEAWFFGDIAALQTAYPRIPPFLNRKARFRNPDEIRGGTCEALERVLQQAGYHMAGYPKIAAARNIASHMDPVQNCSRSFKVFRNGLLAMVGASFGNAPQ